MIAYSKTNKGDRQDDDQPAERTVHQADENDPLAPLRRTLAELKDYLAYYLSAKSDAVKLQVRTILVYAALGFMAGIAGLGALVTAVVLTLTGAANGVAHLLDGRVWAGQLIIGLGVLIIAAGTAVLGLRYLTSTSRGKTLKKYEHWRNDQQAEFGHDILERASKQQRF